MILGIQNQGFLHQLPTVLLTVDDINPAGPPIYTMLPYLLRFWYMRSCGISIMSSSSRFGGTWTSKVRQSNDPISQNREYQQCRVHDFGHVGDLEAILC